VIELAPLSEGAVASLAGGDAGAVYAATGGNPFYVTEIIASRGSDELPPSIANAVVGRAARLGEDARRLVELVSVVPGRVRTSLLDAVMPAWPDEQKTVIPQSEYAQRLVTFGFRNPVLSEPEDVAITFDKSGGTEFPICSNILL